MDCDWVLLKADQTKIQITTTEENEPVPGDGKFHGNIGYKVRYVVRHRIDNPNPLVIATQH